MFGLMACGREAAAAAAKRPLRAKRAITSGARVLYLKLGTRHAKNYTYHRLKIDTEHRLKIDTEHRLKIHT